MFEKQLIYGSWQWTEAWNWGWGRRWKKCPSGSWCTVIVSKAGNMYRPWWRTVLWCGLNTSSCRPVADAVPPPGRSCYWVGMSRERRSSPSGDTIISVTLVSKQQMAQLVTNICRRLDVWAWGETTHQTPRRILNICLNLIFLRSLWIHDRPHRAAIVDKQLVSLCRSICENLIGLFKA